MKVLQYHFPKNLASFVQPITSVSPSRGSSGFDGWHWQARVYGSYPHVEGPGWLSFDAAWRCCRAADAAVRRGRMLLCWAASQSA